jgi:hypothetical protein
MLCSKPLMVSKAVVVNVGAGLKLLYHPHCSDALSESIQEQKADELAREQARLALKAAIKEIKESNQAVRE